MKNTILILLIILITSCESTDSQKKVNKVYYDRNQEYFQNIMDGCHVVTRGGCQYLINIEGYRGFMAHKGDCTNKIHNHE